MSKPLATFEGVRDIYGEEYLRKLMVEEKLHHSLHSMVIRIFRHLPLSSLTYSAGKSAPRRQGSCINFLTKRTTLSSADFTPSG